MVCVHVELGRSSEILILLCDLIDTGVIEIWTPVKVGAASRSSIAGVGSGAAEGVCLGAGAWVEAGNAAARVVAVLHSRVGWSIS